MNDKQLVALQAAKYVKNGMLVGLGTGSTANYFIDELARLSREEGLKIRTVASSTISAQKAQSLNLPIVALEHIRQIDLYVDGADEITPNLSLLKGRGQDLVMEKLLAQAAHQFIVVADKSKLVNFIGEKFIIPIEVMPNAWRIVKYHLEQHGAEGDIRLNANQDNIAVTASGNYVLDMRFPKNVDDQSLNILLNNTSGVVEHGVFYQLADKILIADQGIVSSM